jgi:DNA helicase-4
LTKSKKIEAYKSHEKSLVETTSAEYEMLFLLQSLQKKLTELLKEKYPSKEFYFAPIPYEELIEKAYYEVRTQINELPRQISGFIVIAKTYGLQPSKIAEKLQKEKWTRKQIAFANIALEIFRDYELSLESTNEIDFADMINLAVHELGSNDFLYRDVFDHILVDEYQDLSTQRYKLLRAILDKNPNCKLFAVGDDWQSIMGFAGSNLDFTLRFGEYFDHPAITYISTNYRSAKSIVDLGTEVIRHNKSQLPKKTLSKSREEPPVMLYTSRADKYDWDGYYTHMVDHCTNKVAEYLEKGHKPSDIMILVRIARNPRLVNMLYENAQRKGIKLSTSKRNPHALPVISVHQSKGLQARVVFLLNAIDHTYGFPCTVEDLDLFAPATEGIRRPRDEEERRLFYVAVTRAKENLAVYSQSCRVSDFVEEVRDLLTEEEIG